ncbi:MAG: acetylglutamate kinase [Epsilonproteobacteria bacterium]|nr:acetylglutamate kinase [Campylobacterota bacterium]
MKKKIETVQTLLDALTYITKFRGDIIVVKYGGSAQTSDSLKEKFAQDIALLKAVGMKPVVVHGGGKSITSLLDELNIKSEFIDGQRVTSKEAMRVVEMVLSGEINKNIVSLLNSYEAKAIGISGKDANFIKAIPKDEGRFGYTGIIEEINPSIVFNILDDGFVPVIAPIATASKLNHPGFNINADLAASKIAIALKARKVLFLTDTEGVLDRDKKLIKTLTIAKTNELIKEGVISGGMIPKVNAAIEALKGGVKKAHIIDGRLEHSLLLEILTSSGIGTCIEL